MPVRRLSIFLLGLLALLAGCHDEQVTSYTVPKEEDAPDTTAAANLQSTNNATNPGAAPAQSANSMPVMSGGMNGGMSGPVPVEQGPSLTWTAPSDWQSVAAGPMRKASYRVTTPEGAAELSVTAFPGEVGGELANVNRWRGQAGLPPVTEDTLDQTVDRVQTNGLHATVVDLGDAKSANRILGAIIPYEGGVWFFKLTGPGAVLERQKPAFLRFVSSIKPPAA